MNAINLPTPKRPTKATSSVAEGASGGVDGGLEKVIDMVRSAFKAVSKFARTEAIKRVERGKVSVDETSLQIGDDKFILSNVPYVTINNDPDPENGLAGAIEVLAREFSGPDGLRILNHKYVITEGAGGELSTVAQALKQAEVRVDELRVDHRLFSEAYLGSPQVR